MANLLESPNIQALLKRLSVDDYHKLGEIGILTEKVELIEGVIIQKMPKSPIHSFVVDSLIRIFRGIFPETFLIRSEQPIIINNSEPEPDISVLSGQLSDFKSSHPKTARLVVEVSVSTYDLDFQKQFIYASANIEEYWLINLKDSEVEIYKNPSLGKYLERKIYLLSEPIELEKNQIIFHDFIK